jgi:hypothetical protein
MMQVLKRLIAVAILITSCLVTTLFAAPYDENERQQGQRGGLFAPPLTRDEELIKKLEEQPPLQVDFQEKSIKKPAVVLKGEPGDGLIKLNWVLLSRVDEQNLRFSVRYGTEPEKYTKTVAVGSGSEFMLRELKNFQPYFLQVLALDRDQKALFKSEELRVIPLPLDAQASRIEKSFLKTTPTMLDAIEPERMRRELKQFGYDFFKNSLQLTNALDAMPVGSQYMIGPGDVLSLTAWGSVNLHQELTVDRNGELTIPKVGPVRVWGLPFDKAKTAVNEAMNRYFRNYEMSLTLGKLKRPVTIRLVL